MRKKEENKNIIEVKEEVKIGDVVLEEGDKIEVLNEGFDMEKEDMEKIKSFIRKDVLKIWKNTQEFNNYNEKRAGDVVLDYIAYELSYIFGEDIEVEKS